MWRRDWEAQIQISTGLWQEGSKWISSFLDLRWQWTNTRIDPDSFAALVPYADVSGDPWYCYSPTLPSEIFDLLCHIPSERAVFAIHLEKPYPPDIARTVSVYIPPTKHLEKSARGDSLLFGRSCLAKFDCGEQVRPMRVAFGRSRSDRRLLCWLCLPNICPLWETEADVLCIEILPSEAKSCVQFLQDRSRLASSRNWYPAEVAWFLPFR